MQAHPGFDPMMAAYLGYKEPLTASNTISISKYYNNRNINFNCTNNNPYFDNNSNLNDKNSTIKIGSINSSNNNNNNNNHSNTTIQAAGIPVNGNIINRNPSFTDLVSRRGKPPSIYEQHLFYWDINNPEIGMDPKRLIARSDALAKPWFPTHNPLRKEVHMMGNTHPHRLIEAWKEIRPEVMALLQPTSYEAVLPRRIGVEGQRPDDMPVVLLVVAKTESMPWVIGIDLALRLRDVLGKFDIRDVEVHVLELKVPPPSKVHAATSRLAHYSQREILPAVSDYPASGPVAQDADISDEFVRWLNGMD